MKIDFRAHTQSCIDYIYNITGYKYRAFVIQNLHNSTTSQSENISLVLILSVGCQSYDLSYTEIFV